MSIRELLDDGTVLNAIPSWKKLGLAGLRTLDFNATNVVATNVITDGISFVEPATASSTLDSYVFLEVPLTAANLEAQLAQRARILYCKVGRQVTVQFIPRDAAGVYLDAFSATGAVVISLTAALSAEMLAQWRYDLGWGGVFTSSDVVIPISAFVANIAVNDVISPFRGSLNIGADPATLTIKRSDGSDFPLGPSLFPAFSFTFLANAEGSP